MPAYSHAPGEKHRLAPARALWAGRIGPSIVRMDAAVALSLEFGCAGFISALAGRWRRRFDLVVAGLAAAVTPYVLLPRAPLWVTIMVATLVLMVPWLVRRRSPTGTSGGAPPESRATH